MVKSLEIRPSSASFHMASKLQTPQDSENKHVRRGTMERTSYPFGEGSVKLVSTAWLEDHIDEPNLQKLDCQPNVHDYIQEHIPGAVYMNENLLRVTKEKDPTRYIPKDAAKSIFGRVGLKPDVPVVVYTGTGPFKGWGDGLEQTMVAYSLARFGHRNVLVLDGGIDKWKKERRSLTQEFPRVESSRFSVTVQRDLFVDYDEFREIKDSDDTVVLDARPPEIYRGKGPWPKPGHIPGARNLPWKSLMGRNPRLLKPLDEINHMLRETGVTRDKTIVCTCGTGREATNEFVLLKWYLDYPKVKLYEGSFTEWTSHPENPTVTGKKPR
jgi:thiosulfate/3-mercaptopyruvate sulfurtransferase